MALAPGARGCGKNPSGRSFSGPTVLSLEDLRRIGFTPSAPFAVALEVTRSCNLKCPHCYAGAGKKLRHELSASEIERLVTELDEIGVFHVALTGGEPLMRGDFERILRFIADETRLAIRMNTNATLLTPRISTVLQECGIRRVTVGLDGASAQANDAFRGANGSFERTIEGIRLLKRTGIDVRLSFTATNSNYHELPPLLHLARDLGVGGVVVQRYVCSGRGLDHPELEMDYELRFFLNMFLARQSRKAGGLAVGYAEACPASSFNCGVKADGSVVPCLFFPDQRSANVRTQRFADIWRSHPMFIPFRDTRRIKGICASCPSLDTCRGGCRARAACVTGDVLNSDPLCRGGLVKYGFEEAGNEPAAKIAIG